MSEPFIGEVQIVGFNFAPRGWAQCDGQLLPINQYQALFSLLGTTFGGDGRTTFGLPDMRGRTPINSGGGSPGPGLPAYQQGQKSGTETETLTVSEMPSHRHSVNAKDEAADTDDATNAVLAKAQTSTSGGADVPLYRSVATTVAMNSASVTNAGGGQSHNNMQPYLVLNFVIALVGIFPPRN